MLGFKKPKPEKLPGAASIERLRQHLNKLSAGRICETEKIFDHLEIGRSVKVVNRPASPQKPRS